MINSRFSAAGDRLRLLASAPMGAAGGVSVRTPRGDMLGSKETASIMPGMMGNVPVIGNPMGGLGYSKFFTSILPEAEESLIPYYRDCYHFDSVAGATVDIMSVFPFSDWSLVGLEQEETSVYADNLSRLNVRSLMGEISNAYLVDGAFIGSLIYDPVQKVFQDILVHDRLNCQISLRPFFGVDPVITANSAANLSSFMNSGSPYVDEVLRSYPRGFLEGFMSGSAILDPVTTLYVPRRGLQDQRTTSYLRRILPMYLLEKTLYRGTLLEATKRMRATTHVQVGTDSWEPTASEMQTVLGQFQLSEMDPLGGWIVTRQGVNVQDIRQAGDFWKWTDLIDILVPYKLRALGISEAFLAGDANFSNAEAAIQVFMESCAAYRSYLNQKVFRERIFPLVAVINGMYIDKTKAHKGFSPGALIKNLNNHKNLRMPDLHWHKVLDNHDPQKMDLLTTLGEKGIPVPLKMWAAAAGVDLRALLGDLREDQSLRKQIEQVTGKPMDDGAGGMGSEDDGMGFTNASLQRLERDAEIRSVANPVLSRRRSLLQRTYASPTGQPLDLPPMRMSKSGKVVHSVFNETAAFKKHDALISAACASLQDPERRKVVRERIIKKAGYMPLIDMSGRMR